jgi:TonB family protein
MLHSEKIESERSIQVKMPWDSNTAKGFGLAILLLMFFYIISPFIKLDKVEARIDRPTIPGLVVLNLGDGDGTGLRKGNAAEEGAKGKGEKPKINLEHADKSPSNATKTSKQVLTDISQSNKITAVNTPVANNTNNSAITGDAPKNIGAPDGGSLNSGLSAKGKGNGLGEGLGDIDWGGGGSRTAKITKLPAMPKGVRSSAQIVLRFKVLPDGTVTSVFPTKKADPALEQAAVEALKQWRFNAIDPSKGIMVGTIPITFILK